MKSRPLVLSIVGARPQFVKLAPLAKALSRRFDHQVVHTGQHYDDNMSQVFFRQLNLPQPDYNLGVGGGTHGRMTGRMLTAIERVLIQHRPSLVLVFGDTNSTLAGALAAAKMDIPVGHIEAGMRSFVRAMPEEINRRLTDHLAELSFCSTITAMKNLRSEGITKGLVHSGDLMYELLHDLKPKIRRNRQLLSQYNVEPGKYLFLTAHRAANVDDPGNLSKLASILEMLPLPTVFPVHPRTKGRLRRARLWQGLQRQPNLRLTEPTGYLETLSLACHAQVVLTDSGGLQKEAICLGVPVLTLREETEWVETLRRGNCLVGLDVKKIMRSLRRERRVRPIPFRIRNRRPSEIIAVAISRYLGAR